MPTTAATTAVHACLLCPFVYDPAQGLPGQGIAPGTSWEDLPPDWKCPDCQAGKQEFVALED